MYTCMYVSIYITYIHTHLSIYIYIQECMCFCVYVCTYLFICILYTVFIQGVFLRVIFAMKKVIIVGIIHHLHLYAILLMVCFILREYMWMLIICICECLLCVCVRSYFIWFALDCFFVPSVRKCYSKEDSCSLYDSGAACNNAPDIGMCVCYVCYFFMI
jgi:hypothetical protein